MNKWLILHIVCTRARACVCVCVSVCVCVCVCVCVYVCLKADSRVVTKFTYKIEGHQVESRSGHSFSQIFTQRKLIKYETKRQNQSLIKEITVQILTAINTNTDTNLGVKSMKSFRNLYVWAYPLYSIKRSAPLMEKIAH